MSENLNIGEAARRGHLPLEKLEALTSVCSVGPDMVVLPGEISAEALPTIMADEIAIGMTNSNPTAAQLIPIPRKKAGGQSLLGGTPRQGHHHPGFHP